MTDAPGFHQACSSLLFLPGCSSLSLTSPLNYCVCAHGSVTLNPGFILLSDRRHRRHVCCCDIWPAVTLSAGKCNYSNEIKEEMGYLLFRFSSFLPINVSVFVAKKNKWEGWWIFLGASCLFSASVFIFEWLLWLLLSPALSVILILFTAVHSAVSDCRPASHEGMTHTILLRPPAVH